MKKTIITACLCLSVSFCFASEGEERSLSRQSRSKTVTPLVDYTPSPSPSPTRSSRAQSQDFSKTQSSQESTVGEMSQELFSQPFGIQRRDSEPPCNQEGYPAFLERHPSYEALSEKQEDSEGEENTPLNPMQALRPEVGQSPTSSPSLN